MSDSLQEAYGSLRQSWNVQGGVGLAERRARLKALRKTIRAEAEGFVRTLEQDFGGRCRQETLIAEIATVLGAIDHATPRLARWAASERIDVGWRFWPARGMIVTQPLGVVGIIGPANFPVQLTLLPLIGAVAAGCRVLLKPSELTPATTALLARCIASAFAADHAAVVEGGPAVASAMTRLPLDHLLFTGSTLNGRQVMGAAAQHLTPLTLELGGKSPAVIDSSADIDRAARAIVAGKLMNAGQTCVAPDYVLVPRPLRDAFVEAASRAARSLYPDPSGPGYTAVRDEAARRRLLDLQAGQSVVPLFGTALEPPKVAAALVLDPDPASRIMREEIFGPLLPVLAYDTDADVIAQINSLPHALALYWFGQDRSRLSALLERTMSGTVAVNETVLHAAIEALPFGGVGASGTGAYHGRAGFETFSHRRPVFLQSRFSVTHLLRPPFGARAERILRMLLK